MRGGTGKTAGTRTRKSLTAVNAGHPGANAEATLEKDYAKQTGAWAVAITKTAVTVIVVKAH
jgi:hypothetical protein